MGNDFKTKDGWEAGSMFSSTLLTDLQLYESKLDERYPSMRTTHRCSPNTGMINMCSYTYALL